MIKSIISNIKGTISRTFQLSINGPILKNNGGLLEFKDSTDTKSCNIKIGNLTLSEETEIRAVSDINLKNNINVDGSINSQKLSEPVEGGILSISLGKNAPGIYYGSGEPTIEANESSLYLRIDGNDRLYIRKDNNWIPIQINIPE